MKFEYTEKAPLILVETRLNNKGPFKFVVDTASSVTVVGRKAAETIGIPQNSNSKTSGCCSSKMLAVGSVQIGETNRTKVPIVLGNLSKLSEETGTRLDGIIGSPFMKNCEVTIDYPRKEVAFQEPRRNRRLTTKFVTVNDAGFVVVDVELNGKGPYSFLVDTGATKTVVAKRVGQELGLHAMNQERKALSGFFAGATMTLSKVESIRVGKAKSADVEVGVQDLQRLSSGIGMPLDGVLGYTFMKDYRVTINYPEQALSFERGEMPEIGSNAGEVK